MRDIRGMMTWFMADGDVRQTEQRTKSLVKFFIELLNALDEEHNTKEWVKMRSELNIVRKMYRAQYKFDKVSDMHGISPVSLCHGGPFTEMEIADIEEAGKVNGQITKRLSEIKKAKKEAA